LAWGVIPANRESIMHQLNQSNHKTAIYNEDGYTSNAVVLVVGGAQEALNARPGNYKIVVKKRKGFVRVALETGASLVPVISFGETEVFDQPLNDPGTRIRKFQNLVKKWTGIAPALFYGRGFMSKSSGFLPYNRPITTVIGAPIDVERNLEPSKDDIDELHNKFMEEIQKLFDDNKNKYLKNWEDVTLVME
jgi:2-acylglycerol O-acyltransferase 2